MTERTNEPAVTPGLSVAVTGHRPFLRGHEMRPSMGTRGMNMKWLLGMVGRNGPFDHIGQEDLSDVIEREDPLDPVLGWRPRQAARLLPRRSMKELKPYRPWNLNRHPLGRAEGIWESDATVGGIFYQMIGNPGWVTRLGLISPWMANTDQDATKGFHTLATHLALRATNGAMPEAVSEAMLDRTRTDDYFSVSVVQPDGWGHGFDFSHHRYDPRDPGFRNHYFDVLSPELAARKKSEKTCRSPVWF